ncbi:MAG: T9SS C-terminal target domain-containing protein, partial [Calditrichaeota bacterium]
ASGFLNPAANQNGEAFGLFAALANGQVVEFGILTGISDNRGLIPVEYNLEQNYPNPFNPVTTIAFSLPEARFVSLKIFNILGEEVASLMNQEMAAGVHNIRFDARNLVSGMYFYRIEAGSFREVRRMMLVK